MKMDLEFISKGSGDAAADIDEGEEVGEIGKKGGPEGGEGGKGKEKERKRKVKVGKSLGVGDLVERNEAKA